MSKSTPPPCLEDLPPPLQIVEIAENTEADRLAELDRLLSLFNAPTSPPKKDRCWN